MKSATELHLDHLRGGGPGLREDFSRVGIHSVADLARRDPMRLYRRLCTLTGAHLRTPVMTLSGAPAFGVRWGRPVIRICPRNSATGGIGRASARPNISILGSRRDCARGAKLKTAKIGLFLHFSALQAFARSV